MTWDFFAKYVDEVYAIADQDYVDATGKTLAASAWPTSYSRCRR